MTLVESEIKSRAKNEEEARELCQNLLRAGLEKVYWKCPSGTGYISDKSKHVGKCVQVNSVKEMEEKEDVYHATPISEEEFMESEMKYWTYEPTEVEKEQAEGILNAVKAFHNMK